MDRRSKRTAWCAGCLVAFAAAVATAAEKEASAVTPEADRAVLRGLAFLAGRQHEDGSFGRNLYRGDAGVTSLAGMAFMASGSTPGRGPYGEHVGGALDYVLRRARPDGFITGEDPQMNRPMYGHGFAVLFLAECAGMSRRADLHRKLAAGVKLIVGCQNEEGGWRYFPRPEEADISVSVCELTALRAARNAGVGVPKETIDRAVAYMRKCQNSDGGFMYQLSGGPSAVPRSAAAFVGFYNAGFYDAAVLDPAADYLQAAPPDPADPFFFYACYYLSQAAHFRGGEFRAAVYPQMTALLLANQQPDGGWSSTIDRDCATAMACLALLMPEAPLPIFQR